jgi:ribosomal protein L24
VGLLIIPQQKWYDELPKDIVSEAEWGIDPANITIIKSASGSTEDKSVQNVARHLRNSIAHYHFVIPESNSGEIESVKFEDFSDDKKTKQKTKQKTKIKTFETVMSIENIRRFTNGLTEFALRKIVPAGADL